MAAQSAGATIAPAPPPYPTAMAHFPGLRQSMLAGFSDCQLYAGFELRNAIPRPGSQVLHTSGYTTHRQAAGRLIHDTLRLAIRHMAEPERRQERIPHQVLWDIWDDVLRQADAPVDQTYALPAHEDAQARRTLKKWAEDNWFTIDDVYAVEERLAATVSYPDGSGGFVERVLTGQLDLLLVDQSGTHATVVDYKDTWKLPAKRGSEDDDDDEPDEPDRLSLEGYFQQQFYALLIFMHPDFRAVQSVTLRENYIRRSRTREAPIWRHRLPALIAYFSALAERFDRCYEAAIVTRRGRLRRRPMATTAQWGEPSPGAHCSYCPGAMDCPVPREAREEGMITTPAEAQTVAGILIRAKRVVAMCERSLRTWTDREGPVRVRDAKRDRFFGYLERERVERPTLRQVSDAMLAGRDPRDLYRRRVSTAFTDFSAEDAPREIDPDDVVQLFEAAAERARTRRRGRRVA